MPEVTATVHFDPAYYFQIDSFHIGIFKMLSHISPRMNAGILCSGCVGGAQGC